MFADKYGMDHVKLWRRMKGVKTKVEAHVNEQKLTSGEEKVLSKWVVDGFPARVAMVKAMANTILRKRYDEPLTAVIPSLGTHWITRFLKQHSELQTKFSTQIHKQRISANNPELIKQHFRILHEIIMQYNIDEPRHVYNMDEKGFLIGLSSRAKVI